MPRPSATQVRERLGASFRLDRRWRETMGLQADLTKERALRELTGAFATSGVGYAIIGGIAVQLHTREPRTTVDIDVAVASYDELPREALRRAGFKLERSFAHSENWRAPGPEPRKERTAVQFTADESTPGVVERADRFRVSGMSLRVAALPDLIRLKLAAAEEPRRRPSKRQSDVADVMRLLEEHPEAEQEVPDARSRLARVVQRAAAELRRAPPGTPPTRRR